MTNSEYGLVTEPNGVQYWKWNTIGDKLILRSLKFHRFHGVKLEEKKLGQKFLVDVDAWMDLWKVDKSDNLSDIGIYRRVTEMILH
ncbi:hypothetical protein ES288_D09G085700v1 [Gossypium darwinii]|uniref:dihydroneopterin aldolase n=1 Tax=Gossypium darwinii TaxID=34276 RepID=A0A5D2B720_GOSDA|nr:hypothetical protein ES288_D09G085700v1 [Gossypium darwinii]